MQRPDNSEFPEVYSKYIQLVTTTDLLPIWDSYTHVMAEFFASIDEAKHDYRYAPGKWTIKDVLLHLIDTERGYSYRAIVCVRGDSFTPLYPMDEDLFASNTSTAGRTMADLLEEFKIVRAGMKKIFEYATEQQQMFKGNGVNGAITGRALGYIAIGHALHHKNVIEERYL
ncbi:DinB superfamily protein [Filimonas lacunae]|uniref:DinB superfamily protein n=1 Tax=Filimonas lacunae TaxID=477680 RepID=A0A173MCY3_9BACT|nr:DinB family protein [Filimonas lacunae]BAV05444.1 hypothetical protein FLA_1451 [Filimonas lacunae]SIT21102.1 DinB superfamily protein [Filimonas lacunae]